MVIEEKRLKTIKYADGFAVITESEVFEKSKEKIQVTECRLTQTRQKWSRFQNKMEKSIQVWMRIKLNGCIALKTL